VYAGAVGYFAFTGDINTCIAIRTMTIKDNTAYLQGCRRARIASRTILSGDLAF
jgi:hypothetical protein